MDIENPRRPPVPAVRKSFPSVSPRMRHDRKVEHANRVEKQAQAWQLLLSGKNQAQIAREMGISDATAHFYIKDVLNGLNAKMEEQALQYRALQLSRYEAMLDSLWERAVTEGSLHAMDRILSITNSINKLLGLEAPNKTALTDEEGRSLFKVYRETEENAGWVSDVISG